MAKRGVPDWVMRYGCIVMPLLGAGLAGLMFYLLVVRPTSRVIAARDWTPLQCRVVSSEVVRRSYSTADSRYKADIRFRYTYRGRQYMSNRYDFIGDAGMRYPDSQQRIVDRYPRGSTTTCYVNPARPHEAVLDRGLQARMWWGVLPLVLFLVAIVGLVIAIALAIGGRHDVRE